MTSWRGRTASSGAYTSGEAYPMIEFPPDRVARIHDFLVRYDNAGAAAERVHRTLAQSYKVGASLQDVAHAIGAIGYLLTGEPAEFEVLDVAGAHALARTVFRRAASGTATRDGLLLRHAIAMLRVSPKRRQGSGYIDFEHAHLTLLGGRELFLGVLRALAAPYVEQRDVAVRTWEQAVAADVALWVRADVLAQAIDGRKRWSDWDDSLLAAQARHAHRRTKSLGTRVKRRSRTSAAGGKR